MLSNGTMATILNTLGLGIVQQVSQALLVAMVIVQTSFLSACMLAD